MTSSSEMINKKQVPEAIRLELTAENCVTNSTCTLICNNFALTVYTVSCLT